MSLNSKQTQRRIFFIFFGFMGAYLVLLGRTWQLHLMADERISQMDKQFVRQIRLSSQRGTIYDRKGQVLAISLKVPSVFVDPASFKPSRAELKKLSKTLNLNSKVIRKKVKSGSRRFAWMKRFLDPSLDPVLNELNIKGFYVTHEWKRFYPDKELAGQVLGFVGVDGKGLEGIERFYDDQLRREEKIIRTKKDGKGRVIYYEDRNFLNQQKQNHLTLSIDSNLQAIVENELFAMANQSQAKSAVAVLMDPKNGDVLAMASYPPVNPNHFSKFSPKNWRNRPVQEVFEPGSTFKMFTVATAIDKKIIKPNQVFHCEEGSLQLGRKEIRNIIEKAWLTPKGILKYSNNVGTARIGLEIGAKTFSKAMRGYGFGARTGIGFPGETTGLFSKPDKWYPLDLANMSFGQGIGVSALQLTTAASVLANGGFRVEPNLVFDPSRSKASAKHGRVVSEKTVKLIHSWLEAVTEESGTGNRARIDGYRVAGKTGTAQIIDRKRGSYSHTKVFSSFLGFAPLPNPELVFMVGFREPSLPQGGGEIAAPVFHSVVSKSLRYLDVAPDQSMPPGIRAATLQMKPSNPEETPGSAETLDALKDLRGLTMREVLQYGQQMGLEIDVRGHGVVYSQKPDAGSELDELTKLRVYFSSPLGERRI